MIFYDIFLKATWSLTFKHNFNLIQRNVLESGLENLGMEISHIVLWCFKIASAFMFVVMRALILEPNCLCLVLGLPLKSADWFVLPNPGFRKGRGTRDQIANIRWIIEKGREFQKNIYFCLLTMPKPLTVWITINCGKFWKRWEYLTTWSASWEMCMQIKK